jgi:hypothetical protein
LNQGGARVALAEDWWSRPKLRRVDRAGRLVRDALALVVELLPFERWTVDRECGS